MADGTRGAEVDEDLAGVGGTPVREEEAWWRVVGRRTLERVVGRLGEPILSPSSSEDSNCIGARGDILEASRGGDGR